ncbi:MAG: pilus assembly protein TadE [Chloroflexi bacterium HGW-Chloroflexi-6]|nr:MAG: pilus assembly protein TadE [Chloroflexi bacterium HGW-Chloroflexi-6]
MVDKKQKSRSEKGQSLVELTISLVFILIILAGVVDFGMAFFSWVAIRDASQEGAIYGAVCPNNQGAITTRVRSVSTTPVDLADTTRVRIFIAPIVNPAAPASAALGGPGSAVTVLVEYDYQSITPGLSGFIGEDGFITISASTTNTILTSTDPKCP